MTYAMKTIDGTVYSVVSNEDMFGYDIVDENGTVIIGFLNKKKAIDYLLNELEYDV